MGDMNVSSSVMSDLTNAVSDFSVDAAQTDGATALNETTWTNTRWSQQFGYYLSIPELRAAIDAKATWAIGKGFEADEATTMQLMTIKGLGKESFNAIIENLIRTYYIGGDSFAEVIRDEHDEIINLKVLDPGVMTIVSNREGMILRYEQNSKVKGKNPTKFEPIRILHLSRNRVADNIHGTSVIDAVENIILMRNEAMADYKEVLHRFVKPRWIIKLDSDDTTVIAAEKKKWDEANAKGENMYIPMGSVEVEQMAISANATLNPQTWIDSLNDYFYEVVGTPKIIVGNSKNFTEASSKIVYLTFEQSVKEDQLYCEEQILGQLNLAVKFVFPASLENEVLAANPPAEEKQGAMSAAEPNDTTAEMEGNK